MTGNQLAPGTEVGGFTIESILGEGPSSVVYVATQQAPMRRVALRIDRAGSAPPAASPPPAWVALEHPSIVPVYAMGVVDGVQFTATRLIDGHDLTRHLAEHGRLRVAEAVQVAGALADALDYAHEMGVVHGRLVPSNVLVQGRDRVYVGDFGRPARLDPDGGSLPPHLLTGMLPFLAPELLVGPATSSPAADRYALAAIVYLCLAGVPPYSGEPAAVMWAKLHEEPPSLAAARSDLPAALDAVVRRGLARDPAERFQTARQFVAALGASASAHAAAIVAAAPTPPLARRSVEVSLPEIEPGAGEAAKAAAEQPLAVDEDAQFTVYRPKTVAPATWHTLLAFAHLSAKRPDAPASEPDPVAEVRRQAAAVLGADAAAYSVVTQDSQQAIPREGEITFVPLIPGVEFNPAARRFTWIESVHREEFRLRAAPALDGQVARGSLTVYLGSIILAEVPMTIRVDAATVPGEQPVVEQARRYRSIFASYSHLDEEIVRQCHAYAETLGDRVLRDVVDLRSGEAWDPRLLALIEEADVFQLFWSSNSMRSKNVRREWEHALALGRPSFVRPVFWEHPMPKDPSAGLPPDDLRRLHFQRLSVGTVAAAASVAAFPSAASSAPSAPRPSDRPATESVTLPPAIVAQMARDAARTAAAPRTAAAAPAAMSASGRPRSGRGVRTLIAIAVLLLIVLGAFASTALLGVPAATQPATTAAPSVTA